MDGCSVCGGDLVVLGGLGSLLWFRCRNCSMEQSRSKEEVGFELNEENDE